MSGAFADRAKPAAAQQLLVRTGTEVGSEVGDSITPTSVPLSPAGKLLIAGGVFKARLEQTRIKWLKRVHGASL